MAHLAHDQTCNLLAALPFPPPFVALPSLPKAASFVPPAPPFCVPQMASTYTQLAKVASKSTASRQFTLNDIENQPAAIRGGVTQITSELTKLQKDLQNNVTDKLKKLKESGLNDGNTPWTIEGKPDKGLTNITADIETIKTRDVKDVRDKLKELCTAIRMLAKDAEWFLNELKDGKIGEQLKQIRDEIDKLHGRLVDGPIKDLRALLRFIDNGKAQIIRDLHAFVDKEIKEAEDTLINEARRQCVSNVKELLKLFAQKVEEELNPLPPLITEDLQMGYKGFMYDFQQRFVTHISL
ncbi:hypothetical protein, conserved [Babesia ovata]|uniref:Extracellular matrix-binding ebh n=1 Tax=Babesia ovata TaxID=189622 RepID=A0A2H6KIQ7_9APIC|nr:uncharacterized protein BOVATA_043770 [Babesia ovata]GBE62884.1 hypothetical protein, conserved [Babesia ovata]